MESMASDKTPRHPFPRPRTRVLSGLTTPLPVTGQLPPSKHRPLRISVPHWRTRILVQLQGVNYQFSNLSVTNLQCVNYQLSNLSVTSLQCVNYQLSNLSVNKSPMCKLFVIQSKCEQSSNV